MKLQAQIRAAEDKLSVLRAGDMIPVVCYGPDQEAITAQVAKGEFIRVYREAGSSMIIDLEIGSDSYEVLVKDMDYHPVSEEILHVDFYAIKRGEEMQLSVPIVFIGESEAAKSGAVVNEILHELEVRCLPRNIPAEIEVDLSALNEAGASISIADLALGEGVVAVADTSDIVANASDAVEEKEDEGEDAQAAVDAVLAEPKEDSE